jgi:uncharacterized protein YheU (UPF0270 family)
MLENDDPYGSRSEEGAEPVVVPYTELSEDALRGVVESFVLREGTEYGARDFSLDEKVAHVLRQLRRGEAQIVFDPASETVDVVVVRK